MLNKDKIENFAFNCGRPFTAYEAAELCNVSTKKAQLHIQALRDEGKIELQRKVAQKHFYIWKGKPKIIKLKSPPASKETADKIEQIIMEDGYTSLRDVAHKAECSYELVRLVIADRGLANVNIERENSREMKATHKNVLKTIRAVKKIKKQNYRSVFLESITPYPVRG